VTTEDDIFQQRLRTAREQWDEAGEELIEPDRYTKYLLSPEWAMLRSKVFQRVIARDGVGVCEGCREQIATQVHHLTYEHVGHEFLWELVAICEDCHKRLHGK